MARRHPENVIEAIGELARAGKKAPEIRRQLASGKVPGVRPYPVPMRTIQEIAAKAKREAVPLPDDDIEAVEVIERRILKATRDELERLLARQKARGGLTTVEHKRMATAHKTVDQIRTARQRAKKEAPVAAGSENPRRPASETLLGEIAAEAPVADKSPAKDAPVADESLSEHENGRLLES